MFSESRGGVHVPLSATSENTGGARNDTSDPTSIEFHSPVGATPPSELPAEAFAGFFGAAELKMPGGTDTETSSSSVETVPPGFGHRA